MEQIKFFRNKSIQSNSIETEVNEFLSENETKILVKDIQYNTTGVAESDKLIWTVMVRYEVL